MKWMTILAPLVFSLQAVSAQRCPLPGSSCSQLENACLAALQLSEFNPADIENYHRWWSPDGFVVVAETGTYEGMDSVKEYMSYGTGNNGVYFAWSMEEGSRVPIVLSAGVGDCEVAFVSTFVYDFNEPAEEQYTKGGKISATVMGIYKFSYSDLIITGTEPLTGSANIVIEKLRGFYPKTFWKIVAELFDTKAFKKLLCKTMRKSCRSVWNGNDYCPRDCKADLRAMPPTDKYANPRKETFDWRGTSIGCRQLHLAFVVDGNPKHCAHISGIPMRDSDGVIKCQDGNSQVLPEDLFSTEELSLAYGIGQNFLGFDSTLLSYEPAL
uniref:SnoaL-like domain-containing protein n=1 Tax=Pseudictyota dubia TaxID=2749911 RepID=A0A7R9Z3G6_9STRA|mmetsp:Transcript_22354/g.41669  ORF Transcript_22354/g.41669 Transcript_22354/m.41669 type:complete len:326 (+) Transcript_22354:104-1081(+)